MCGIIGYVGRRSAAPILLDGLSSLEYRGYDSTGIAVITPTGEPVVHKKSGKLARLRDSLRDGLPQGNVGIGHTRWATHGRPTDDNAHPHSDCGGDVLVIHNGIIENYAEIRRELTDAGHHFSSQTDSECIPHLIESHQAAGASFEESVRQVADRIQGANVVVAVSRSDPSKVAAFRLGNAGGVVVGYGEDEMLLASDLPALLPHTREVAYLTGGEMVTIARGGASYSLLDGTPVRKLPATAPYNPLLVAKGEYKHFMLKEMHEQPEAVIDTLRGRVSFDPADVHLEEIPYSDEVIAGFNRVVLLGMGTSLNAALLGRAWMETLARVPSEADNSSEFRYRDPVLDDRTLVVSISQSGETADTLAAMDEATRKGARQITLCNYPGAQTTRVADGTILIRAGPEISVASSKTFVCSLVTLYALAMHVGIRRGVLGQERVREMVQDLAHLPRLMGALLSDQSQYEELAARYASRSDFLYLGRGLNYPLAMEGALKLKELSYLHAEGYPAGEMKHGPISLIDENMPVVALMPRDDLYGKMLNNVNEVKARGGIVLAVATEGDSEIESTVDDVIYIPKASPEIVPILMAVPMQLLAYHVAVRRGCDVDQPRNLAKSVTVE